MSVNPRISKTINNYYCNSIRFDSGINTYLYANANSLRFVDELGLYCAGRVCKGDFLGIPADVEYKLNKAIKDTPKFIANDAKKTLKDIGVIDLVNDMKACNKQMVNLYKGTKKVLIQVSKSTVSAFNNAHQAAQGYLITAGAITITPVVEATAIPAIKSRYGYVMSNPKVIEYGLDFVESYLPTGTPSPSRFGYGRATLGYFYGYENFIK